MSRVLLPPVIYSGIPLAVTGGVLRAVASWDTVQHYDRGCFIALSGVAVLNGLVIISYFNQLREEVMKCGEQVSASHMNSVWPCLGV
jgi:cobalt-zinc-cadmium resistance protein CzcA